MQRSLSSLLGVALSDVELAAVCIGCADKSGGNTSNSLLIPGCKTRDDGSIEVPVAISNAVLAQRLDNASISAGRLVNLVNSCYENW